MSATPPSPNSKIENIPKWENQMMNYIAKGIRAK